MDIVDERKDVVLTDDYRNKEETDIVYFGSNDMKWYDNSAKLHFLDSNYIIIEDNFGLYALQIFDNKQLSDNTFKLKCYDIEGVRNDVIIECIGGYVYITIHLTDKIYIKYKTKQV